jgi:hypothetical protein
LVGGVAAPDAEQHEHAGADARDALAVDAHGRAVDALDEGSHTLVIMSAVSVVDDYVGALPGDTRKLGHGEWGITLDASQGGGWPLDVGLRVTDELLRVQAFALGASDDVNPWNFLHWNRGTRMVRFSCTRAGDIWVQADLPVSAVDGRMVDRLLGLVVEGAVLARTAMASRPAEPGDGGEPTGWGAVPR